MKQELKIQLVAPIIAALVLCSTAAAQDRQRSRRNVQSGTIELQSESKKDSYAAGAEELRLFLTNLQSAVSGGYPSQIENIKDDGVHYLTAMYLYCSIKTGVCPFFLDSLLEADVINSRLNNKAQCKNLRSFWKRYLANDMETRHQHATKIGFLTETGNFNNKERPKYIKCEGTVAAQIKGQSSAEEFFRKRYTDKSKLEAINQSIEFVNALEEKKINVFNSILNPASIR